MRGQDRGQLPLSEQLTSLLERIRKSTAEKTGVQRTFKAAQKIHERRHTALELFRPFPYQDEFILCDASEVLVRGGVRSGKSTVVGACIASYVLAKPMYLSCGIPVQMREPEYMDKQVGEIWVIGKQMNHSSTIFRVLFQPGAFQIVRDPVTKRWRAWQPGTIPGDDKIPADKRKEAPPLIPASEIKEWGWEKKTQKEWNTVTLHNGWTLKYYPSNGSPKRGDPVHRIWLDEETENDDLYPELQSRISDFKGRIWWSSWPNLDCASLINLYDRAIDEQDQYRQGKIKKQHVYQMSFISDHNPVIDKEEHEKRARGWDEATARARNLGEFVRESRLTYPEFNKTYHAVEYGNDDTMNDKVTEILRARNFIPPSDWCVDLILDPGTNRPALLWVATPPPSFWYKSEPYHIVYRELTGKFDAEQLAHQVQILEPARVYHRWIIDHKCGDQTSPGDAHRIEHRYAMAFSRKGLKCDTTGTRFMASEHVWLVRSMELRAMFMPVAEDAPRPKLRIVTHRCPELIKQITRNMRRITKEDIQDVRASGQIQDLLDCLEYFAGSRPIYRVPTKLAPQNTPSYESFMKEESFWSSVVVQGKKDQNHGSVVCGVP